ncbi:hypothetical protein F4778DRAFT_181677 [Xylariomycetidae sp. FL2044]|nr:hypothetical protein F4778DRAFT_181677 [Xylariomycetidae sp. FL2044]
MLGRRQIMFLLTFTLASLTATVASARSQTFEPSLESAQKNGPHIFNSVHDAMREFGSALHHNGMSLFPAVIPEGVLLYHGTHTREVPKTFEWLAFEIEHAENFARSTLPPTQPPGEGDGRKDGDLLFEGQDLLETALAMKGRDWAPVDRPREPRTGYLHIYQATRPLRMLYIDGTSAGKTNMGTVDTQDYFLTNRSNRTYWDERSRAVELCDVAGRWNIDGFIRMEPGFEAIYCDFSNGLRLVSTNQEPSSDGPGRVDNMRMAMFQWARAASQRYLGIGASRVRLSYSSMISAFFYPLNLTNPNPKRPELPRLSQATEAELDAMREHLKELLSNPHWEEVASVDWQGVTDMVVSRFADPLLLMSQTDSLNATRDELNNLLNIYIDYSQDDPSLSHAQQRCSQFYLQPVTAKTPEDHLIHAAIQSTTTKICSALFAVRRIVIESRDANDESLAVAQDVIRGLMGELSWSKWKECGRCGTDEMCFVAMWPFGAVEDHYAPSCLNYTAVAGRRGYWGFPGMRPHPPPHNDTRAGCGAGVDCELPGAWDSEEL